MLSLIPFKYCAGPAWNLNIFKYCAGPAWNLNIFKYCAGPAWNLNIFKYCAGPAWNLNIFKYCAGPVWNLNILCSAPVWFVCSFVFLFVIGFNVWHGAGLVSDAFAFENVTFVCKCSVVPSSSFAFESKTLAFESKTFAFESNKFLFIKCIFKMRTVLHVSNKASVLRN